MKRLFLGVSLLSLAITGACYGSDEINLNIHELESEAGMNSYSISASGDYGGRVESKYPVELREENDGNAYVSENIDKISRNDVLFCVGMSYPFDKEVLDCYIEDSEIINCYNSMLNGLQAGSTKAVVTFKDEVQILNVTIIDPIVNTDTIKADSEDFKINVFGDIKGADVKYDILSDSEEATIDQEGNVHVPYESGCLIKVEVAGKVFTKEINGVNYKSKLWNDMQYGIQQCLGTPYVMGGFAPGVALDCSGYVSYVYNTVGLMSGRTSAQGLYNMCKVTDTPEPGDLVFFAGTYNCPDYITHVGLYAGGNMMYHSGKPNQLTEISGYYAQHFVGFGTLIY